MKKRPPLSPEDRELFRGSLKNVRPLKQDKIISKPARKIQPMPQDRPVFSSDFDICELGHDNMLNSVGAEDSLSFVRPGLQERVIRQLRRGEFPIAAELDLHGLTVIQAHRALYEFLIRALARSWRCVAIIHGKGGRPEQGPPILKNRVNFWLRQYPCVLAFCSAQAATGGKGAVYVLLKTKVSSQIRAHPLEPMDKYK